jgi:hypothetical protein
VNTVSGSAAIGWSRSKLRYWLPRAVNRRGAVSPAMRATASRAPVMMPGRVVRMTTERLVLHRGYPRARAASRRELGTSLIISSVVRRIMGTMSSARATLPARAEKCFCVATIQAQAKTPTTIEGVPFSTSATKRVTQESRLLGYSAQ